MFQLGLELIKDYTSGNLRLQLADSYKEISRAPKTAMVE